MDVLRDIRAYVRTESLELSTRAYIDLLRGLAEWASSEASTLEWRLEESEEWGESQLNNN